MIAISVICSLFDINLKMYAKTKFCWKKLHIFCSAWRVLLFDRIILVYDRVKVKYYSSITLLLLFCPNRINTFTLHLPFSSVKITFTLLLLVKRKANEIYFYFTFSKSQLCFQRTGKVGKSLNSRLTKSIDSLLNIYMQFMTKIKISNNVLQ